MRASRGPRPPLRGQHASHPTSQQPSPTPAPAFQSSSPASDPSAAAPGASKTEVPAEPAEQPKEHTHSDAHVPEGYDEGSAGMVEREHASVYISQVLPIRVASWDPRPAAAAWFEELSG